jgi:SAM-dependent methyltransferase
MPPSLNIADKRTLIRELVPGRSFVDVGGLWGVRGEMVSVALKADASAATMIDITPLTNPLWQQLRERVLGETLRPFKAVHADASAADFVERVGAFDIVHSAGVIYHLHSPIDYLINLRRITREYLIFSSATVPDKILYEGREIDLGGGRFLSTHGLDPEQKEIVDGHFAALGLNTIVSAAENLLLPDGMPDYGPWWWLFTAESLRRLLSMAGFDVLATASWQGRADSFLCRPRYAAAPVHAAPAAPDNAALRRALAAARQAFGMDAAWWSDGMAAELRFWKHWVETGGAQWPSNFQSRSGPNPPLDGRLETLIRDLRLDDVDILDVGAGPLTTVGTLSQYCRPRVHAIDPLARPYARLLREAGIAPAVETEFAAAETLPFLLPPRSFDVVHCRNALDEAVNPLIGILQMLAMLRPGGVVYLRHATNAAEHAGYTGAQQFNFELRDDTLVVANTARTVDIGEWLRGLATVEPWPGGLGAEALIRLADNRPFEVALSDAEMADLCETMQRATAAVDEPAASP